MKAAEKLITKRIQQAVNGFLIPMGVIVDLYKALERAVAEGKDDAQLREVVAAFPRVTSR